MKARTKTKILKVPRVKHAPAIGVQATPIFYKLEANCIGNVHASRYSIHARGVISSDELTNSFSHSNYFGTKFGRF